MQVLVSPISFGAAGPGGPVAPAGPAGPWGPCAPVVPFSPLVPLVPFVPLVPGVPWGPGGSLRPGNGRLDGERAVGVVLHHSVRGRVHALGGDHVVRAVGCARRDGERRGPVAGRVERDLALTGTGVCGTSDSTASVAPDSALTGHGVIDATAITEPAGPDAGVTASEPGGGRTTVTGIPVPQALSEAPLIKVPL
jgi:hypothetical protein